MPPAYLKAPDAPAQPYRSGCTGKRMLYTREDAIRVRNILGHKAWYHCQHCTFWHTTTRGKPRGRRTEA